MTDFNLEGFKSSFGDGARSNLFYYIPNFPGGVDEGLNNKAKFLVKSTNLPATSLEEVPINWQGYDFKYAGKHTYADFTVTFNTDKDALIRFAFENWINKKIHNPETNEYFNFDNYMLDQKLQLLGYNGTPVMEYTLHDAWPKEVATLALDYGTTDIATFDVTFTYSYHTVIKGGTGI